MFYSGFIARNVMKQIKILLTLFISVPQMICSVNGTTGPRAQ